jgi:hypothetical protein
MTLTIELYYFSYRIGFKDTNSDLFSTTYLQSNGVKDKQDNNIPTLFFRSISEDLKRLKPVKLEISLSDETYIDTHKAVTNLLRQAFPEYFL